MRNRLAMAPATPTDGLASTGKAATAIGVTRGTLHRWWIDGTVTPTLITPGGHARWDIDDLRRQLRGKHRTATDVPENAGE